MRILAIETSCDETAAAIVEDGTKILGSSFASSTAMHEKYGGIVPEVAAREQLKYILPVINQALLTGSDLKESRGQIPLHTIGSSIDAIAVTVGPGLIGSLLVGVETAKTLAFALNKPIIPVNHVLAHIYANFVNTTMSGHSESVSRRTKNLGQRPHHNASLDPSLSLRMTDKIQFPGISLVVSGGHTELYLMKSVKKLTWLGGTLDDAAGECFDKTARLLGFGNRGGLAIQEAAKQVKSKKSKVKIKLPRPMLNDDSLNFSFSGLKTAVLREVNKLKEIEQFNNETIQQLSFEIQETITDVLVAKTLQAAQKYEVKSILLSGGVAANTRLREKFNLSLITCHLSPGYLFVPPINLCTDNAVYIAAYAYFRGQAIDWHSLEAIPDLPVETAN